MTDTAPVGLVLGSHIPPEQIPRLSQRAERGGFGEVWLAEDYFFTGGIAGALAALGATSSIPVGLGVVSAMARHPAVLAMEIATAARLHPGRLMAGIGLGTPHWIRQMGLHPKSPLTAMRESVTNVARLLAGEQVTFDGKVFHFDAIELTHAPDRPVPLYMGVIGPKMLRLAGEIADGTVASGLSSAAYIGWLRERVAEGQAASTVREHRVVTFALYGVDADSREAKRRLRETAAFYLAMPSNALFEAYGISEELAEMQARGGAEAAALIEREMPDQWMEDLVVAGDPDECAAKIRRLIDAGSDSVALFPVPVDRTDEIVETTARDVLPQLRA
jgi:5,10-methylenetetrahydromethanopterin reductase